VLKPVAHSYNIIPADYFAALSSSVLVLLCNLVMYRLASFHLGVDGFSQYAIARRILSFVLPLVCVGIGVALPRKIAETEVLHNHFRTATCFMTSLSIVLPVAIFIASIINIFPNQFSFLILGNEKYNFLAPPLGICIIGLSLQALCYSYLRGRMYIRVASFFQVGVSAILPLVSFYLSLTSITFLFWYIGIFSILASFPIIIGVTFHSNWKLELPMARALFSYGIRRVPGDFALGGLFALPSIICAHFISLSEAGMVAFGASILNMATTVMAPFSLILLPHSTRLIKANMLSLLRVQVNKILLGCVIFSLIGIILSQMLAEIGIGYWLGAEHLKYIFIVRYMIFGILPYAIYISLRSVLDAAFFKAVNANNIYISLTVFIGSFFISTLIFKSSYSIIISFLIGLVILSMLTYYQTWRFMKLNDNNNFIANLL
jgi:O-antigen/teichoic acid export membrane protein